MCRVVAYYRVSTEGQGRSGLGLEAQRHAVRALCDSRGWEVIDERTEIESGKNNTRPELDAALQYAEIMGAVLVVAKLDRLSRDAEFTLHLRNSGVEFVCADNPDVNRLTIGLLAVINEDERERIAARTRAALQAAKARGTWLRRDGEPYKHGMKRLGNPNGAAALRRAGKGNLAAVTEIKAGADGFAARLATEIARIRAGGATSLPAIAAELNARGVPTRRGGKWHPSSVRNLLARLPA
ncbi:MAG: recombinase family protein [Sphingopyxis sp.]|nr:recombinase family protein [Sphingopyxis sp.]